MEGSEGLRWSEGERSDCCRWAASSWVADMVDGGRKDGLEVLLHAHCLLACCCESGSYIKEAVIVEMRLDSDSDSTRWVWRGQGAVWSALQ